MTTLHGGDPNTIDINKLTETENAVFDIIKSRWAIGRKKYGLGIEYNQHSDIKFWIEEAIEECADQLQYLVALKISMEKQNNG
jgi:hypothetical protein